MKSLTLQFTEIDSESSFASIATALGAKSVNNVIRIPSDNGAGTIKKINFEDGLALRAWDLQLKYALQMSKVANSDSTEKIFHVACVFSNNSLTLNANQQLDGWKVEAGKNILFISSEADLAFGIEAGKSFQAIDISVTSAWLLEAFNDAETSFISFINQLKANPYPIAVFESSSATEYRALAELHRATLADDKGKLLIKAEVLSILSDFFCRIFSWSSREILSSKILYYDKMLEAEKILNAHLQTKLPSIEVIAKQLALSESTLKRHFKMMFGKSIYDYYLELKMDFAKRMLLEKPLTVNEVAAMVDYEKVSNFIGMFKKHHGFSPGTIRKADHR